MRGPVAFSPFALNEPNSCSCRSQWSRCLRRVSAGRSLFGIVDSNPRRRHRCLSCECCVLSGWSLVQGSATECGVSEDDRGASIMRRPWPTRGCCAIGKKMTVVVLTKR
jgi:hypothetical protein